MNELKELIKITGRIAVLSQHTYVDMYMYIKNVHTHTVHTVNA